MPTEKEEKTSQIIFPDISMQDEHPALEQLGSQPNLDIAPDPEMIANGWQRRFMADDVRKEEAIQLYEELGFEVRSMAVKATELSEICGDCRLVACTAYSTIYTRKRST